ncbi:5-formyltetrahydrofolate cyclo-ligase [Oricola indica]|uniref:5-formyltetrahydrofolate cyclo-ligase n=1 Tax=Oricola indica TaxID=2872591 RepID=UPI003CCBBCE7
MTVRDIPGTVASSTQMKLLSHCSTGYPRTATEVEWWRKTERRRLIDARLALPADTRLRVARRVTEQLDGLLASFPDAVLALYWPFRGEIDLRDWMTGLPKRGVRIALPVVVGPGEPLVFREWGLATPMVRGPWNIPVPAEDRPLVPEIVVAPLIGVDRRGYRLGYGRGHYDRTLGALPHRALSIGIGHPVAEIPTVFPQSHERPLDWVILGKSSWERPRECDPAGYGLS